MMLSPDLSTLFTSTRSKCDSSRTFSPCLRSCHTTGVVERGVVERVPSRGVVERGRRGMGRREGVVARVRRVGSSRGGRGERSWRAVVESRRREWSSSGHRWPQQRCGLQDEHTVGVLDIVKLSREHFWLENLIQLLSHRQALTECGSSFLAAQIETGDLKLLGSIDRLEGGGG